MVYFTGQVMSMDFYTVTDLRTASKKVWDSLSAQGHVVITNNGKPAALMIDIADNDVYGKLETAGNANGNPQKCKGEIPGIASGH